MKNEIKVIPPDGFKVVCVNVVNNEITATIEKIEDDFGKYWKRYCQEIHYIHEATCWEAHLWFVLIDFYRWFAKELNGDWKPDWKNRNDDNYCIYYNFRTRVYEATNFSNTNICFNIYFSQESVEKALKILPKEFLDKLFQI
ncbi:MAG: hypothetical protein WC554_12625 [Clostridia bacterium]